MDKQQTAVKDFLMKAYYVDERINRQAGTGGVFK